MRSQYLSFLLALTLSQQVMAIPLCAEVLKASVVVSQADIDRTIENIARLKMTADLELASGSAMQKPMKAIAVSLYQSKFSELMAALQGIKTVTEIRHQIVEKIVQLQSPSSKESQEKTGEAKRHEKDILTERFYLIADRVHKDRIALPREDSKFERAFEYIPQLNSLVVGSRVNKTKYLDLLDLNTGKFSPLFDSAKKGEIWSIGSSTNGKFISVWFVSKKGSPKIAIFNTHTLKWKNIDLDPSLQPLLSDWIFTQQVSPSGNYLVVLLSESRNLPSRKRVYRINVKTGEQVQAPEKLTNRMVDSEELAFINDHEFVHYSPSWHELLIYNFQNDESRTLSKSNAHFTWKISRDSKDVFINKNATLSSEASLVRLPLDNSRKKTVLSGEIANGLFLPLSSTELVTENIYKDKFLLTAEEGQEVTIKQRLGDEEEYDDGPSAIAKVATGDSRNRHFTGYDIYSNTGTSYIDVWAP